MRIVLNTPAVSGTEYVGGRQVVIPDGCPPQVGTDVDLGDDHYRVRGVTLVVDDSPYGAWVSVRLETVEQFVRRRDLARTADAE
jgi:hypothetical protein